MRFALAFLLLLTGVGHAATAFQRDAGTADTIGATLTVLNTTSPSFTRGTGAYNPVNDAIVLSNTRRQRAQVIGTTSYNSDLIENGRSNLLVGKGEAFQQWTAASGLTVTQDTTAAPNGETIAQTLTDPGASLSSAQLTFTVANDSLAHVFAIYVLKTAGGTAPTFGVTLGLTGGTPVTTNARINTDTGTQQYGSNANTYIETSSAGTWYRIVVKITNNTSGNTTLTLDVYPAAAAYGASVDAAAATGTAICTFSELEKVNFITSYCGDRGLLLRSEAFGGSWILNRVTITSDTTANPLDSAVNADTMVEDATVANTHLVQQAFVGPAVATVYTFSCYIKQSGRTWTLVQLSDTTIANGAGIYFDVANGAKGTAVALGTGWTLNSSNITAVGSYYRCDVTATTGGAAIVRAEVYSATGDLLAIHNGNSAAALILYGGQLVYGAKAKTYWPTFTTQGNRTADQLTSTLTVSTTAGTLIAVARPYGWTGDQGGAIYNIISATSAATDASIKYSSATQLIAERKDSVNEDVTFTHSLANNTNSTFGLTWNSSAITAYQNGPSAGTDTSLSGSYTAVAAMGIGERGVDGAVQFCGEVLGFYSASVLPPSTMQIFANGVAP